MLNTNIVIFLKEKPIKSCSFVILDEYMYFNCMCNNLSLFIILWIFKFIECHLFVSLFYQCKDLMIWIFSKNMLNDLLRFDVKDKSWGRWAFVSITVGIYFFVAQLRHSFFCCSKYMHCKPTLIRVQEIITRASLCEYFSP